MGDLHPKRDWGYAGDYVKAMWAMLQQDEPDDYVVATGQTHTVEEFVAQGFRPRRHRRLAAVRHARIRASSARPRSTCWSATPPRPMRRSGWRPEVDFDELVKLMVDHDLKTERTKLDRC